MLKIPKDDIKSHMELDKPKSWRTIVTVVGGFLIVVGIAAFAREYLSSSSIQALLSRVNALGHWGPILMALIYILACVLVLPASVLTLAAGFLFGLWKGYVVVAAGSVLGASAAFWIGRTFGREWVRRKIERNPKFSAIDRAVAGSGFKIVVLTRLSPVFPFNLQNFAYGVTGVAFRDYFWASWIGMVPGTVMFVYLGSAMKSLADAFSGNIQSGTGLKIVGLAATVAVTMVVTREATKALKAAVEGPGS